MANSEVLVTVVIPAYNAEATIDTTLESARAQTHQNLEIVVVVDGATDNTEALVRRHAEEDARISVIVTPNRGLCPSRNTGAQAGTGPFIAPLDADDVWHPTKIEKQLAAFGANGAEIGFVYTLFRRIDQWDYLIRDGAYTCWSGQIFNASLLYNCVGNGSSIMVRREAFDRVGGYAMELNRMGCEDYLLQIRISHDWSVGVVPEYLTGYRFDGRSMSRSFVRMAHARLKMLDIVLRHYSDVPEDVLKLAQSHARAELAIAHARAGAVGPSSSAFAHAARISLSSTAAYALYRLRDFAYRFVRNAGAKVRREKPPKFLAIDPTKRYGISYNPKRSRVLGRSLRQASSQKKTC